MTAALRLYWWNQKPNFGDGISPLIVAALSGRRVVHADPGSADLFAVGSVMQNVARTWRSGGLNGRPWVWGSGMLRPVGRGFLPHVRLAALRGPRSAAALHVEPGLPLGDPGLLVAEAAGPAPAPSGRIGIVPHHSQLGSPVYAQIAAEVPGALLIDVTDPDPLVPVRAIAACRHVFASSLHGLVVADAYGVPNSWMEPDGIHAEPEFKFTDYALSVGRDLGRPLAPSAVPAAARALADAPLPHAAGVARAQAALRAAFPAELRAGVPA